MKALAPGATIGIVGGGQLGRMLAIAAAQMGYRCHIYAPESDSVAAEVAADFTCAAYDDMDALMAFAKACDVVTYEFENVPVGPLKVIGSQVPIRPGLRALEIAQDRVEEKLFAVRLGGRTAPFEIAGDRQEVGGALEKVGFPAILKTIRMGYDGKGQVRVNDPADISEAWHQLGRNAVIAERMIQFDTEFSVILVRSGNGEIRSWDCPRNRHEGGILARSSLPAGPLIESQCAEARTLAAAIADELEYVGVLTCEFFATADGPIFNEMAPRVHNSGHWTIEGAVTSQFENHIRAVCELPLGATATVYDRVEMDNLIGEDSANWRALFDDDDAHVHLYGKGSPKPGRKMGHVTRLYR
ncbi:5-(carboxyamino)imidazole ribonucleotide synthase [Sphingorhabdus sp.]|jgi:5-(carboxyamino)imidazole ribonucleotide synthase|uniref:5-(carboxyamino)imidazole ribonucleotide synthase n=1 Tax=Sphingorhabdus sp. TaxID=1902408 RepID=UPI003BB01791|nr:5-(carboxyamino)imidazole ribonucleotide synthase [Sphingomonadales bacterium]MBK9431308.1 5-(carboxyamino)imidazole ribonucleotide synthase [Sphingomonadales bacterium]MBL0022785.1 5-(carboxyamino)imidazole ribonucleotide synthase [Sphingomonadales bacterium]